jgi:hypothetical protein
VGYYREIEKHLGLEATRQHARLFLIPGMDHCRGGDGAYDVDYIGALEQWVEADVAPDRMLARRPPGASQFTRPCAHFSPGTRAGDQADAANWEAGQVRQLVGYVVLCEPRRATALFLCCRSPQS